MESDVRKYFRSNGIVQSNLMQVLASLQDAQDEGRPFVAAGDRLDNILRDLGEALFHNEQQYFRFNAILLLREESQPEPFPQFGERTVCPNAYPGDK